MKERVNKNLYTFKNQSDNTPSDNEGKLFRSINGKIHRLVEIIKTLLHKRSGHSHAIFTLLTEGGINFFRYIKNLGLSREPNLIVLSSKRQYDYDKNDLKRARILINLKKLNEIKHLDVFLDSLCRILPENASFIGYFSDLKNLKVNEYQSGWLSGLRIRLKNFLDLKTEQFLDENRVSELLKEKGFRIINSIRMNGLTYFYSQNLRVHELGF